MPEIKLIDDETNCARLMAQLILEKYEVKNMEKYLGLLHGLGHGLNEGSLCGALTGGYFAINVLLSDKGVPLEEITAAHNDFRRAFKQKYGSVDCANILGNSVEDSQASFCAKLIEESSEEARGLVNFVNSTLNPIMIRLNRY